MARRPAMLQLIQSSEETLTRDPLEEPRARQLGGSAVALGMLSPNLLLFIELVELGLA